MATQLTSAQLQTLKAAINANQTWAAFPLNSDGYFNLADLLKAAAPGPVKAWRLIPRAEALRVIDPAELDNLYQGSKGPALNFQLNMMNGVDCTTASGPRAITDIVTNANPAAPNTRAALLAIATENLTLGQQIFGGSPVNSATPPTTISATLRNFSGQLAPEDIEAARNS